MTTPPNIITIQKIMDYLPHRYPMLLVDRVIEIVPDERIVALKNVTINEPFFTGHFPGRPIMPGVLMIEALAQAAGILVMTTLGHSVEGYEIYFLSIDHARFRKPVEPGDTLHLHAIKQKKHGHVWRFETKAYVGDTLVAEAICAAMIVKKEAA